MNNKPIDRTKKSNIKCEHCMYWQQSKCMSDYSDKYGKETNYWNRCKAFDWKVNHKAESEGEE